VTHLRVLVVSPSVSGKVDLELELESTDFPIGETRVALDTERNLLARNLLALSTFPPRQ
jgi:hypothetical protein